MSDYFDFPPDDWGDNSDDENPFRGLPGWVEPFEQTDPYEQAERFSGGYFTLENIERIIIDISNVDPDILRGNRFADIGEALNYLLDSGVLDFSYVVIDGDEILVAIDDCTQPPCD